MLVVPAPIGRGHVGYDKQGIRGPIDARHSRERVVNSRGECSNRDLDDLRETEFTVLLENAVSADLQVLLDQCLEVSEAVRRPDACKRLASQYKLSRSIQDMNEGLRPQSRRHQSRTVDLLYISAMFARDDLTLGDLPLDDLRAEVFARFPVQVHVRVPG